MNNINQLEICVVHNHPGGCTVSNNTKYLFLKFTVGYYTDCFKKSQGFFQYLQCESGNKVYLYKYGIPGISG